MTFGKGRPKLAMSYSTRRLRLGVTHSGTPSSYIAPTKDVTPPPQRNQKKRRG